MEMFQKNIATRLTRCLYGTMRATIMKRKKILGTFGKPLLEQKKPHGENDFKKILSRKTVLKKIVKKNCFRKDCLEELFQK